MSPRTSHPRLTAISACILAALFAGGAEIAPGGCTAGADQPGAEPAADPSPTPATTSAPAATSTNADQTSPQNIAGDLPAPPPLAIERTPPSPLQAGWAELTEHADGDQRAWVEGEVINGDEFTINTANVRRFALDLTRVRLDWSKRIVLRMDGFNSELTKKRWPTLNFVRTPAGAWDVVED